MQVNRVGVIGIGKVGSAVAYSVANVELVDDVILYNRTNEVAVSEAMDIQDAFPMKHVSAGQAEEIRECDIIVMCVGTNKYLQLNDRYKEYAESSNAVRTVCEMIGDYRGIIINVTNPLETITKEIKAIMPDAKVIDTGTIIDKNRLIALTKNTNSEVVGRHDGDKVCYIDGERVDERTEKFVANRAWQIVEKKGYTNWAIAKVVKDLVQQIVVEGRFEKMGSFENKQGITEIEMTGKAHCFCPLGNDWYDAEVKVLLTPTDTIMDYCDVDTFFESLNGGELIIEDVVNRTFNYFSAYKPEQLRVTANVDNARHLPVSVTKSM